MVSRQGHGGCAATDREVGKMAMATKVERFFVRRMKTRWGSCTPRTRRIRLNTELAKKSPELLEYVVVHEMVHLIERYHNDRFVGLMDRHLPNWRDLRKALNNAPPTLWIAPEAAVLPLCVRENRLS